MENCIQCIDEHFCFECKNRNLYFDFESNKCISCQNEKCDYCYFDYNLGERCDGCINEAYAIDEETQSCQKCDENC
jgi:hypothetical protein